MQIFIGADHRGFELKQDLIDYLKKQGHNVVDSGSDTIDPDDDFTVYASQVVSSIKSSKAKNPKGILICGSGQGMVIAANRYKGIRAGLGWSESAAKSIRTDEDSNVLALPSEIFHKDNEWKKIVDSWLTTPFAGAKRYVRRNSQLDQLG